jgi:predicted RNA-binding protein
MVENIFALHSFFELIKLKKKKLFAAFVDFKKAFDTAWRDALWSKLLINNINGKMTTQNGNRAKVFWIQRIAFVFINRFNVS